MLQTATDVLRRPEPGPALSVGGRGDWERSGPSLSCSLGQGRSYSASVCAGAVCPLARPLDAGASGFVEDDIWRKLSVKVSEIQRGNGILSFGFILQPYGPGRTLLTLLTLKVLLFRNQQDVLCT